MEMEDKPEKEEAWKERPNTMFSIPFRTAWSPKVAESALDDAGGTDGIEGRMVLDERVKTTVFATTGAAE